MRISIKNSGNDKQVYIVDSFRSNGKIITKTIMKCGKLSELKKKYEDPISYFTNVAKQMTFEKQASSQKYLNVCFDLTKEVPNDNQTSFNVGYLFLQKLYYQLKLDKICDEIKENSNVQYDLNKILKDLVFSRILYPSSKLSTFDCSKNYLEQPNYELHDLYRALDLLSNNIEYIQSKLYKNSNSICNRDTSVLYYDCTNYYFELEKQDGFRNYGISKEHRPNPIVQMGLFMDANGIPLAFNINPGNTSEQITPIPTEKFIEKDFNLSKFIYCSDAGLGSYNNKWFNSKKNRGFIVTQSLRKIKGYLKDWALSDNDWNDKKTISSLSPDSSEILYKSRPVKESGFIKDDENNKLETEIVQNLIVTYSPLYAKYQKTIRDEQINRAIKIINSPSSFDKYSANDCKRFIQNIAFNNKTGEIINKNLILNTSLIEEESMYDGFYAIMTNLDDDPKEIVRINHNRWKIEQSFRIMKTDFKARPVFLQKENRIKAHFLTCFISLLIFRILEQKINTDKNHFSSTEIIDSLKNMNLFKLNTDGFASNYTKSRIHDCIYNKLELNLNKIAFTNNSIKKLINSSKK